MKIIVELNIEELTEEVADKLNELVENNELLESWEEVVE